MPLRVLIVGPSSSTLLRQRVEMLNTLGHELYWYSQGGEGVPDVTLYKRLSNIRLLGGMLEVLHVSIILVLLRPAFVHVFYAKNRWLNLVLSLHSRLIVTVMGSDISDKTVRLDSIDFKLVKLLLNRAKVITSKSAYIDQSLKRFSVSSDRIQRLTWGIDTSKFNLGLNCNPLRLQLGIPNDCSVFFSLRACKPLYQHEKVMRAFSRYVESQPKAVLLLSTMGAVNSYLGELKTLGEQLSIESKVIYLPAIDIEQMPLYYNLADAVISIPKSDGMPQSLYESIACGCFHILGDLPQYREIVEPGKSGIYTDFDDEMSIAMALHWVTDHREELAVHAPTIRAGILPLIDRSIQQAAIMTIYTALD